MRMVIVNGNGDPQNSQYEEYLAKLGGLLEDKGNEVSLFNIRNLKISRCIGCYTCWVKTPGICVFRDDMVEVLKESVRSDFLLFASPVITGYISALLKRPIERLLPLSLPYISLVEGRLQHPHRYGKAQQAGLVLWSGEDLDRDTCEIIDRMFKSNLVRRHRFTRTMDTDVKEIADEINAV
jgi:multimeric flavodoxin WrbA